MPMRRAQLQKNSYRQRLAAPGIAETLCRLLLSLSHAKNRRGLSFRVNRGTPPTTLCDAAANGGSFALVRMTARHISQLILRGKSSCSKPDVKRWHNPRTCTSAESSLSLAGLNFSSALGGMGWWRLEF